MCVILARVTDLLLIIFFFVFGNVCATFFSTLWPIIKLFKKQKTKSWKILTPSSHKVSDVLLSGSSSTFFFLRRAMIVCLTGCNLLRFSTCCCCVEPAPHLSSFLIFRTGEWPLSPLILKENNNNNNKKKLLFRQVADGARKYVFLKWKCSEKRGNGLRIQSTAAGQRWVFAKIQEKK